MSHNLTEVSTFTATVQVPDDGDFVNESSVEVGFQALANRTKYLNDAVALRVVGPATATDEALARFDGTSGELLMDGVVKATDAGAVTGVTSLVMSGALSGVTTIASTGDITAGDDIRATGDFEYVTPPTRTIRIPGRAFQGRDGTATNSPYWSATTIDVNSGIVSADISAYVRTGMVITTVNFRIDPGAARAGADRMNGSILYTTGDGASGSASEFDDASAALQTLDLTSLALTVNRATTSYVLQVGGGNTAGASQDHLLWAEIVVTDPGPNNH